MPKSARFTRKSDARNKRDAAYKYYQVSENHSIAIPAGRCKCGKVTDIFCDECNAYCCENHVLKNEDSEEMFCKKCAETSCRELNSREKRKIRKAKICFE